ncbi:amino acid adenylation domain-containing protein [Streptomyces dangxiongensis]|uniref:Amino acid adenylation domain-containing protein n=1 Tax=Streptomyces dangxiongensis TaxID=1442032 RepID=A0A3G2J6A0_9ACTN|nr:non-ribosomal peptide synthetase [Streptomyces dangxiongensis]AYN37726.1 amino acid adenylation domain-containing protein [Streptomyces dangxiongensis]
MNRRDELRRVLDDMTPAQRAKLARHLAQRREQRGETALPILPRTDGAGRFPASPGQERIYFLHELDPDARAYIMPVVVRLRGRLDETALAEALRAVVRRHEALRTGFEADPALGMVAQVVRPADGAAIELLTGTAREDELPRLMEELVRPRFGLAKDLLLRAALWRTEGTPGETPDGAWTLGLVLHHIVADGWSLGVLVKDLAAAYTALVTDGTGAALPSGPGAQYADFAAWQREWLAGDGPAPQRAYWRKALRGAPVLSVPGDRVPPAQRTFDGSSVPLPLPAPLEAALTRVGREEQATLFMVLLAAYAYVLHRWSGEDDVVVGTPVAGRGLPETETMFGFFVNTLALRVDLAGAGTFRELVRRVRDVCLEGFAHQDLPFEQVVQELDGDRKGGRSNLVNALLTLTNVPLGPLRLPGVEVVVPEQPRSGTDLDLSLEFTPVDGGGLEGWLIYSTDLFERSTAERIAGAVRQVLDTVAEAPAGLPLHAVPVMTDATREELLHRTSGRATAPYPGRPLADWFSDRVDEAPDRTALVVDAAGADPAACETLGYAELDARANRLAHWLRRSGLATEDRIGIYLDRGTELVTAILGVLKAGGVCVPLDPDHPEDRLAGLVDDCRPRFVLTDTERAGRFHALPGNGGPDVVALNALGTALDAEPATRPEVPIAPMGAAYMLYTSGSTGRPKGVVLTHHGLGNRLRGMCDALAFTPDDTVLHKSTINSDPALWELLVPLFSGARVVLALPGRNTEPAYVHDVLARHRVTACDFVPSLLHPVLARPGFAEAAADLRVLLSGGEELPPDLATRILTLVPGVELYNCYGPTEASLDVAVQRVTLPVTGPVPIGAPVTGAELYVLDERGRLQPPGVPGELLIGGVQISRGYLGMPGRTAASHVPHPFRAGERLYRTGDLARWRSDGALDYLGRIDRQVKIRGYRVEPGEVETALRAHPAVDQAAVAARPRPEGGHVLAAYLTLVPGTADAPAPEALRRHLAGRLPTPMLPSSFTVLDDLPRNANGKTDLLRLPAPAEAASRRADRVSPSGPLETVLAGIWAQTLGQAELGVEDDFFDLGGHSLMATLVVSQVRELFRVELPLHFFIQAPTIAALARMVRAQGIEAGVDTDRVAELVLQVQRMSSGEVTAQLRD